MEKTSCWQLASLASNITHIMSLPYIKPFRAAHFLWEWTANSSRGLQRSCVFWAQPTWYLSPRLSHFLLLIPIPVTLIFFSCKTPNSFWPRSLALAVHSAGNTLLPDPPKTTPNSWLRSQLKSSISLPTPLPVSYLLPYLSFSVLYVALSVSKITLFTYLFIFWVHH